MLEIDRILDKGIIHKNFLLPETRCNFFVDENRKKIWAIELDLLFELDRICKEHNLKYFLSYGSMLGAVRHKGFIPWDDDIDVCMFRSDFEELKKHYQEFVYPYFLQTPETEKGFFYSHIKLRNSNTTAINKAYRYSGFNFGMGIDIYPIDNRIMDGIEDLYERVNELNINNSNYMRSSNKNPDEKELKRIQSYHSNPYEDFEELEKLVTQYNLIDTEYCGVTVDTMYKYDRTTYNKILFEEIIEAEFEGYRLPIPKEAEKILEVLYGDWKLLPDVSESIKWHDRNLVNPDVPYKESLKNMGIE